MSAGNAGGERTVRKRESTAEKAERIAADLGLRFFRGNEMRALRSGALSVRAVFWVASEDGVLTYGPSSSNPMRCASWLVQHEAEVRRAIQSRQAPSTPTEAP